MVLVESGGGLHVSEDGVIVFAGGPDVAEEVGGGDVTVFAEEFAVAAAAEHDVGVEFAAEFGAGLGDDAREVGEVAEGVAEGGEVGGSDFEGGGLAVLFDEEVIAAGGGDEEGGGAGGLAFVSKVFNEVKEFAGFVTDGGEEGEVLG